MKLDETSDVSPAKLAALKERIGRLAVNLALVEESFTRGGGKGGQKVNKTSNAVVLKYPPLGLVVRCHRERKRSINRFLALRELVDRIEMQVSPATSARLQEFERIRGRKAEKKRRAIARRRSEPATGPSTDRP